MRETSVRRLRDHCGLLWAREFSFMSQTHITLGLKTIFPPLWYNHIPFIIKANFIPIWEYMLLVSQHYILFQLHITYWYYIRIIRNITVHFIVNELHFISVSQNHNTVWYIPVSLNNIIAPTFQSSRIIFSSNILLFFFGGGGERSLLQIFL